MNKFIFHGVGQGLFYSGSLMDGKFNFVYDCGSASDTEILIDKIESLPKNLDFVAISHLHNDHINGLVKLLEKCEVKKIYLPYFNFAGYESVLLSYMAINGIDVNSSVFKILEYVYSNFNNENAISIKKPSEILSNDELKNDSLVEHIKGVKFVLIKEIEFPNIKSCYWRFRFFNKKREKEKVEELNEKIKDLLKDSSYSSVEEYIGKEGVNSLEEIYKNVLGNDLNITSLILLHYPRPCCCCTKQTLLTGDAVFDDDLNSRVGGYLNSNIILQVPHHGAYNEWYKVSNYIKGCAESLIFSVGKKNKYHHPSVEVFNEIIKSCWGNKIHLVYENNDYTYYINDCNEMYLYHYCSLETFEKIIKNRSIRFSDITKSNDSDEINFAINCYCNYLDKKYNYSKNFDNVKEFLKSQIQNSRENEKTYCFCLSAEKDLLSQWRGDAPNGGIAIGFNYNKLSDFINNTKVTKGKIKLDSIKYVSKDNPIELENIFDKWNNTIPLNNYSKLLECAEQYKNDGFEEEKEYRMHFIGFEHYNNSQLSHFIEVGDNKVMLDFQLCNNCKDFRSYYDVPITLDLIEEIIIGPKLNLSIDLLKSFLNKYGNKEIDFDNLKIELTKLTYR